MIGYVASKPKLFQTKSGRFVTNMRVGVTPRLQDRETGQWSDGVTSYLTVTCWRSLATNVAACLRKGDPVVVKGRMRVRNYDDKEGKQRVAVEVDASTLGHDLNRGVAHFLRTKRSPGDAPATSAGLHDGGDGTVGQVAADWPAAMPDETQAGPEHAPDDDDFSAAELFDDAEIEASSVPMVPASEQGSADADSDPDRGAIANLANDDGSDIPTSAEESRQVAA